VEGARVQEAPEYLRYVHAQTRPPPPHPPPHIHIHTHMYMTGEFFDVPFPFTETLGDTRNLLFFF